jgi:hypothetical protein
MAAGPAGKYFHCFFHSLLAGSGRAGPAGRQGAKEASKGEKSGNVKRVKSESNDEMKSNKGYGRSPGM